MKRDRDGDAAIDRMIGAELRETSGAAEACPEAGELAAFVEGGLSSGEREAVERHAAACERCQGTLALVGSAQPAAPPVSPAPRPVTWLRWAMPVGAVVLLAILYTGLRSAMMPPDMTAQPGSMAALETGQPADQPPVTAVPPADAPASNAPVEARHAETPKRLARETKPGSARPREPEKDRTRSAAAVPSPIAAAPNQVAAVPSQTGQPAADAGRGLQSPTVQQRAEQIQVQQIPAPPPRAPQAMDPFQIARGTQAPAPTATKRTADAMAFDRIEAVAALGSMPRVIVGPDWSVRWRLEPGGGISRSRDGGSTWQLLSYKAPSTLLAGSAPASDVCWLVGGAGTVLLTTDGERWTVRPFPERVDLVRVGARDRLHATVRTSDGRQFVTDDGGATWKQP